MIARGHGATVQRFRHDDPGHLEELLRSSAITPRVIALDGVNSMLGNAPDLRAFARLAREHDAFLYVDDAHGFGVVGERVARRALPWGKRGNGVIRHQGETYENVIFVAGFSKAYSLAARVPHAADAAQGRAEGRGASLPLLGAFADRLPRDDDRGTRRERATRRSRPASRCTGRPNGSSTGSTSSTSTRRTDSGYPLIEVPLADHEDIDVVGRYLFDSGLYVTMAAYPLVPMDEVGFRIQITAANGDEQIERLCQVLGEINERFELQHDGHRELLRERAARAGGNTG